MDQAGDSGETSTPPPSLPPHICSVKTPQAGNSGTVLIKLSLPGSASEAQKPPRQRRVGEQRLRLWRGGECVSAALNTPKGGQTCWEDASTLRARLQDAAQLDMFCLDLETWAWTRLYAIFTGTVPVLAFGTNDLFLYISDLPHCSTPPGRSMFTITPTSDHTLFIYGGVGADGNTLSESLMRLFLWDFHVSILFSWI